MWLIQANIGLCYNKENLTEYIVLYEMFFYLIMSLNINMCRCAILLYNVYNWIMQFHAT